MAKQMNRGERFVFNETHLQFFFFPKLKNYEIKLKKKKGHRNNALNSLKQNPKRPILRDKIVLLTLFSKIALCIRSCMHYNKYTHQLKAQKVTG